jgi:hypothetical protein
LKTCEKLCRRSCGRILWKAGSPFPSFAKLRQAHREHGAARPNPDLATVIARRLSPPRRSITIRNRPGLLRRARNDILHDAFLMRGFSLSITRAAPSRRMAGV